MADVPEAPKGASSWLDLLDKANRLNLIPLLLALAIGYAYWTSQANAQKRQDEAEARTRAALERCAGIASSEGSRTREEVRRKAGEVRQAIQPGTPDYADGGAR